MTRKKRPSNKSRRSRTHSERSDRSESSERSERSDRSDRSDRSERSCSSSEKGYSPGRSFTPRLTGTIKWWLSGAIAITVFLSYLLVEGLAALAHPDPRSRMERFIMAILTAALAGLLIRALLW